MIPPHNPSKQLVYPTGKILCDKDFRQDCLCSCYIESPSNGTYLEALNQLCSRDGFPELSASAPGERRPAEDTKQKNKEWLRSPNNWHTLQMVNDFAYR